MRNLGIALIAAAALCLAAPAFADRDDDRNPCGNRGNNCEQGGGGSQGGGGFGDITNTNRNTNTNTARSNSDATGVGVGVGLGFGQGGDGGNARARGGDATARVGDTSAFSGVDFGRADIGNSTNDLSNRNRNNVSTSTSTEQGQQQGQIQGQLQGQQVVDESSVNLSVSDNSDNSTFVEAADIPVASAAPVFASACSAGVSGQSMGFGGSLATTNPMCDMALAAEMARAVGNDELAYELTMEAATFARARTNVVRRFGQWIPFIGSLW